MVYETSTNDNMNISHLLGVDVIQILFQAGKLAMERGWSINVGGGFHHCSSQKGGGFCAYADITLTVEFLLENYSEVERVMIIDLDAHQVEGITQLCVM